VTFDTLAKLAATRKVKAIAAWCARNRILSFRDAKNRPCTTLEALNNALYKGKELEPEPDWAALDRWLDSRAGSASQASLKKTAATALRKADE